MPADSISQCYGSEYGIVTRRRCLQTQPKSCTYSISFDKLSYRLPAANQMVVVLKAGEWHPVPAHCTSFTQRCTPPLVASTSADPTKENASDTRCPAKDSAGRHQELLWRQFFLDHTLWWDNRRRKKNARYSPDFRHRESLEVLWLNDKNKPGWVDGQLAALDMQMGGGGYDRGVTAETVSMLCEQGQLAEAVEALGVLVHTDCCVSQSLFYTVLKKCVGQRNLVLGRRVHALTVQGGCESDTFLCNHVMQMYASYGRLQDAMDVFAVVAKPNAFTWSAIISAHVKHGQDKQAMLLYHQMRSSSMKPDGYVFVAALQACARGQDLQSGQQVHADVLASGVEPDLFVCNSLVDMYAKCGCWDEARRVFDGLGQKDVVTWNSMIAGYSQQGMGQEALDLHKAMQEEGIFAPDSVTFVSLLQACTIVGAPALEKGKQLHAQIRRRGLQVDVIVANSLVNMYAKCGSLDDAQRIFDGLGHRDVVTWNALIAGYSHQGRGQQALGLYTVMQEEGSVAPDVVTFMCLLQACASAGISSLEKGKELHRELRERGFLANVFVGNSLVDMYAKCGSLEDARRVFDGLCQKNVVTWSAMIAGYSQQGMGEEALGLYKAMQQEGISAPDSVTFACLLQACASTQALEKGRQLHAQIREENLEADVFVASSLISMYGKCGSLEDARGLFDKLGQKNVVTWSAIIAAYSQQGMGQEALGLYTAMQAEGMVTPNSVTFVSLLQACASVGTPTLDKGKQLHAQIREQGLEGDACIANSLVNMYAKCGSLEDAQSLFDRLDTKDVVTWNAMIAGYSQHGMGQEALHVYKAMQADGIAVPDCLTFVCLLQACARVAALHVGKQLHAQIEDMGLGADASLGNSLINMYAKSGSMVNAQQVFDALPERDVVTWSALIAGYTRQGDSEKVFDLLLKMREDGIQPEGITFLGVLTVCSHMGLVTKGREYFEAMSTQDHITPTVEHYTCMVDLLGRAGQLQEALSLVTTMPVPPNTSVWHTLLGACRKWGNVQVGRHAFDEAVKLDEKDAAAYVLMLNIYTGAQMWDKAREMQARRIGMRAWKQPGQSWWTDMEGLVHNFLVGDKKHPESEAIYATLQQLLPKIMNEGYVPHVASSPD